MNDYPFVGLAGGPSPDQIAKMEEQHRIHIIETYRQTCALHFMMSLITADKIRADEGDRLNFERIADNAKRAADALVNKVFPE